jgi:hypothetical protein
MMHGANDPAGTTRPAVKAVSGTTYFRFAKYNPIPWGNYSTTCIDPSDPNRFWTYQEYANSTNDGQWCTVWASFQFNPIPSPRLNDIRPGPGIWQLDATGLSAGVDYHLQTTTNLISTVWSDTPAITAVAPFVTLTNSIDGSTQRFYRLAH